MPKGNTIPAKGRTLRWAREYRGLTPMQAAHALQIDEHTLRAIEAEREEPSRSVFRRMEQVYQQPEAVLLLPSPPLSAHLPTDYRTAGNKRKRFSADTIAAIRDAQELQALVSEVLQDEPELLPHADIRPVAQKVLPDEVASRERARLKVSLEQQMAWPPQGVFARWRNVMQSKGILVLAKDMPWEDCRGFSLYGPNLVPVIVVNTQDTDRAKAFTLFHEYGHLLRGVTGVCIREEGDSPKGQTEAWCNRFAAAMLLPAKGVTEFVRARYKEAGPTYLWDVKQLRTLATRFRVSRASVALRLQELQLADLNLFDRLKKELLAFDKQKRPKDKVVRIKRPFGWRVRQKIGEIGLGTATALVEAWKGEIVDATELADALGLDLDEVTGLGERVEVERAQQAI